ncbi:MAG: hypothetical protein OXH28_00680 [bacterium]|nr:hypothetical protein [bacterium]
MPPVTDPDYELIPEMCADGRVRMVAPHGTLYAHNRHKRRRETPCDACNAARARYDKQRGSERGRHK